MECAGVLLCSYQPIAERSERCARLTKDVAAKAVELLNAWMDGTFEPQFEFSEETAECRGCHFKGKDFAAGQFTRGNVECLNCHESHPLPPESTRIRSILNQASAHNSLFLFFVYIKLNS